MICLLHRPRSETVAGRRSAGQGCRQPPLALDEGVGGGYTGRRCAMPSTYRVPGAILTEREHALPLDHARPDGERITVFTREVAAPDGEGRPYLLWLSGGPGMEGVRPTSPPSGWMKRAVQDYRVLLLDQRGTGRSTPVGPEIPGTTA